MNEDGQHRTPYDRDEHNAENALADQTPVASYDHVAAWQDSIEMTRLNRLKLLVGQLLDGVIEMDTRRVVKADGSDEYALCLFTSTGSPGCHYLHRKWGEIDTLLNTLNE